MIWNPWNPTRKDHPAHKLVNDLMHNPWDDIEVMGTGGSWPELDRAVIEIGQRVHFWKWNPNMGGQK